MPSSKRRRIANSQNFLHSRKLVAELVDRSSIGSDDVVVEIGPGKGIITEVLADRSRHVIAIEKDRKHAGFLCRRFGDRSNVTVFASDVLEFPLPETPFKVFANIPYRITSAIVAKLTTGLAPPADAYLTVQQEAAAKFAGIGEESMVSACMKPWFEVSVAHRFRRRDFVPRPSVESVLLRIALRDEPRIPWQERERYRHLVEAVFSAWQPTVDKALRKLLPKPAHLVVRKELGQSLAVRPSSVTLEDWVALFEVLDELDDDRVWTAISSASSRLQLQQKGLERPTRTRSRAPQRAGDRR